MPHSSLERRLVRDVLAWLVPATAAGSLALVALGATGALSGWPLAATLALGVGAVAVAVAGAVWLAGRPVARTLREVRLGTELMATVNPDYRLGRPAIDEVGALAEEINRLAGRLADARGGLEREVARATADLQVERAKLTAVLEALGEGVAVVTPEALVTLANPEAHRMLGAPMGGLLGRNLVDFVDREKLGHFLDRLRARSGASERFTLHPVGGAVLETVMTPFFDGERRVIGVVLVLHDATRPARAEAERQRLLTDALREARGPLASVRSLSESLLRDPTLTAEPARRLLEAIHADAVRLSDLVKWMGEPARLGPAAPWHFESVTGQDLVAIVLRRLGHDASAPAIEVDVPPALPPLRAEVSALSTALAHLSRALLARRGPDGKIWLRLREVARVVQIDVGAEGGSSPEELEPVLDGPLSIPAGAGVTVREILQQHAGEAWAWSDAGRVGFKVMLPSTGPADRGAPASVPPPGAGFIGAGLRSGGGPGPDDVERADFYDFSLFEAMARAVPPEARHRRLDELTCVVFDIETTGLHPEAGDRIVSIAGVRVRRGAVKRGETFDALVNPRRSIPPASVRFHGITGPMVAEAPPIDVVLPAFLRFSEGAALVGHQVWFDVKFLAGEAARLGLPPVTLAHPILDTVALSEVIHGTLGGQGLEAIAGRLGVAVRGRHSALGDALVTAEIFVRLVELLRARGVNTLGEAIDAARQLQATRAGDVTPGGGP